MRFVGATVLGRPQVCINNQFAEFLFQGAEYEIQINSPYICFKVTNERYKTKKHFPKKKTEK